MDIIKKIYTKLFPLKAAIKEGMQVGEGVSIVSRQHCVSLAYQLRYGAVSDHDRQSCAHFGRCTVFEP